MVLNTLAINKEGGLRIFTEEHKTVAVTNLEIMSNDRCEHGVESNGFFCTKCRYHFDTGIRVYENKEDLITDLNKSEYIKLREHNYEW